MHGNVPRCQLSSHTLIVCTPEKKMEREGVTIYREEKRENAQTQPEPHPCNSGVDKQTSAGTPPFLPQDPGTLTSTLAVPRKHSLREK